MPDARPAGAARARPASRARGATATEPFRTAEDLGPVHDPGPDAARLRLEAAAVDEAAAEPLELQDGHGIRVGTASWTDPTMTAAGVFYPSDADTAEERLAYYASRFPVVEVDATYYALPSRRLSELWVERTPPDFVFDIKAHALLTGQPTETKRLPKGLREALPGDARGEAAAVRQGPARRAPRRGLADLRRGPRAARGERTAGRGLPPVPEVVLHLVGEPGRDPGGEGGPVAAWPDVAVEFRNASWFNEKNVERTLRFLEDEHIPLVMVDGPQGFKSSIPPVVATTSPDLAVVRFHGRRTATWESMGGLPTVERFRYLYERDELREWVPRVIEAAGQARDTHVLMNNCYANYGSTNARELAAMLAEELVNAGG